MVIYDIVVLSNAYLVFHQIRPLVIPLDLSILSRYHGLILMLEQVQLKAFVLGDSFSKSHTPSVPYCLSLCPSLVVVPSINQIKKIMYFCD